jgi:hypothetical protein
MKSLVLATLTLSAAAAMIAQSDPISGGAGWVGAGLLGLVLSWVFLKHLPDKDKQLNAFLAAKDEVIKALTDRYEGVIKALTDRYEKRLEVMAAAFEAAFAKFQEEQKATRHDSRDLLNIINLRNEKAVAEMAVAIRMEFEALGKRLERVPDKQH